MGLRLAVSTAVEHFHNQNRTVKPYVQYLEVFNFLDVARPRQAIGQAERREDLREADPRGSVGGGRASSRKNSTVFTRKEDC
eukprot:307340-Prorocentrum_minimum.AAC.1